MDVEEQFSRLIDNNTLVHLTIIKRKQRSIERRLIPCRIISYDHQSELILIYADDTKQSETVSLYEIEELHSSS